LTDLSKNIFSEKLQNWYQTNARDLPWRKTTDPYLIWLSEIILQQTRVAQGMPYYLKFAEIYPTVNDLADAPIDEVLRHWQGLGYYSRARNMHNTAQIIKHELGGLFPKTYADLLKLKGVGTYTAAAIASFAYHENVAVLDGNVYRVLARLFGENTDITSPTGKKVFTKLAAEILPKINSATHNQAIMEFGALHCTPKGPLCITCTLAMVCAAFNTNTQAVLPVKLKKITVLNRYFYYFIIEINGKYYLKKRTEKGIWQGLFDFLLIEKQSETDIEEVFNSDIIVEIQKAGVIQSVSDEIIHILTHQKLHIRFVHIIMVNDQNNFYQDNIADFYIEDVIETLPKPIVIANYFNQIVTD
jgi:A/G-specific adenine glycosylase